MKFIFIFLCLLSFQIFGESVNYGWDNQSTVPAFYMKGKKVFQANESLVTLPPNFSREEMIDYALVVGEFYINKLDKENISQLIVLLRKEKEDYELVETFLSFFWKHEKGEYSDAENKLKSHIEKESDSLKQNLAEKTLFFLQKKPTKQAKITYDDLKNFNCGRSNGYYSICRVLKLRLYLEYIQQGKIDVAREYPNLDRLLAPFFEEEELSYLPFLDKLLPELGAKLAFLGFASEAAHFQKMLIAGEKSSAKFDIISYEKLSFYQMISGDFNAAEDSLVQAFKSLKAVTVARNSILLKLGMLSYVKKDYKQALSYLMQLNFKYWGRTLRNPISDETISVNGARDLLALVLWKARSAAMAIKALGELKTSKPDEEDLFIRLRIAHIMFKERASATEKMTEDIIYIAQSKGWKRVEYAATLLNGYTNIINKKHRKAVIQFTKSYGILGNSEPSFTNEWMRQSGMILARIQGRERGNHALTLMKLIQSMKNNEQSNDFLTVKLFLDQRYGPEEFLRQSINYFITTKNYEYLVTSLYYYYNWNQKSEMLSSQGSLQVSEVNRRIHLYKGFRPSIDNVYYKSGFSNFREEYAKQLVKENDEFDINTIKKATLPTIAIFPFQDQYFVVSYIPESKKWAVQIFNSTEYRTGTYYSRLLTNFSFLGRDSSYQIFFNPQGLDLYQYLARQRVAGYGYFFFGFKKDSFLANSEPVGMDCGSKEARIPSVNYYPMEYFEGSKAFDVSKRLHIWSFYEASNRTGGNPLESYQWKCSTGESLEFKRLRRRVDQKTVPTAILFSNPMLHNTSPNLPSNEFYPWIDFWMRKGVSQIVYIDRFENDIKTETAIRLLSNASTIPEEWTRLHTLWKGSEREGMIIWREPK